MFEGNNVQEIFCMIKDFGDDSTDRSSDKIDIHKISSIFQEKPKVLTEEDFSDSSFTQHLKIMNPIMPNPQDHLSTMNDFSRDTCQNEPLTPNLSSESDRIDNPKSNLQNCKISQSEIHNVKISDRKKCNDSIFKKIKVDYHRYLIDELNKSIKESKIKKNKFKFGKFSQKMVTNVTIESMRNLLSAKLGEILKKDDLNNKEKWVNNRNIVIKIEKMQEEKKLNENSKICILLNLSYAEVYDNYFRRSDDYIKTIEHIKCADCADAEYFMRYQKASETFTKHFFEKQPNRKRKLKNMGYFELL